MEEAPVVVTAATGALGPVIAKLSTLLRRHGEYKLRRGTRKDIKLIRSKLRSIHSILWMIWEREDLDEAGKELRMEAWRLADDMNDAIDDFIVSLKRSNDGRRYMQAKNQPNPFQDLKRRADDVWERCHKKWKKMETAHTTFSSLFSRTKSTIDSGPGKRRHRVVDPYVRKDISRLVEMEEPRDKLVDHLVGEEESTLQLKMASILGGAGMGKTTLARLVYEAIEDKFEARAFVSITSCHNMTEVLASIYQQVQGLADSSTVVPLAGTKAATAEKHLIDDISTFLKDKRYLVIIDDIWHYEEWEIINKSLPDNNLGSRIVTTSRVNSITEKLCQDFDALLHKLISASDFSNKMIDMNPDMVGEGFDRRHPIVYMCDGMPLAVACMFSALAKERERQEQQEGRCVLNTPGLQDRVKEQVNRNGIQNTPGFEPLVESLELGYNHLPHHMLKTCLLYSSIYPNYKFRRGGIFARDHHLVRRWIAHGFVRKEEVAKDYFDELVSRRFITNDSLHPMMQNYLRWKLREDNFITCTSDLVDTLSEIDWLHIRCLIVFDDAEKVPYKNLENLRVLDLQSSFYCLKNQHIKDMCGLFHLRHLLVSGDLIESGITEMPAEIARLQYLETLEVSRTVITRLPAEIGDLKQLKTLDVSWNYKLAELPREMRNLQNLETLIIRDSKIREQAWEIIWTLKKLKTLDISDNPELSGIRRGIGELQQLKNLNISKTGITELPKEIGKLQHLETLNLYSTEIKELPREIGNLQRLQILNLGYVSITKLPQDIWKLQHLEALYLSGTNVKIPRQIGGLKKLKNLEMDFRKLPFIVAGQLSKLEGLPNYVRRLWKNSDLASSLAGEILSCSAQKFFGESGVGKLVVESGDGELVVGTKHMHIPLWIKEHFNNIVKLDIRICKLEEQDVMILRDMPHLIVLSLRFEVVPIKQVAFSRGGFAKLSQLIVDSRVPRITFQEGAMPRLWLLVFEFQFYGGPPNTDHPMGIKHLVSLRDVRFECNKWYRADSPCISATIDVVTKEAWEHPNKSIQCDLSVRGQERVVFERPDIAETSQGSNEASSSGAAEIEETQA